MTMGQMIAISFFVLFGGFVAGSVLWEKFLNGKINL
jgi:hypothetical protein